MSFGENSLGGWIEESFIDVWARNATLLRATLPRIRGFRWSPLSDWRRSRSFGRGVDGSISVDHGLFALRATLRISMLHAKDE